MGDTDSYVDEDEIHYDPSAPPRQETARDLGSSAIHTHTGIINNTRSEQELADTLKQNPTFLHLLIQSCEKERDNWNKVLLLLLYLHTQDQLRDVLNTKKSIETNSGTVNLLPIQLACCFNPPVQILQLMTKVAPETVKERDEDGDTPLHYACMRGAPLECIRLLVGEQVHAREWQGSQDRTPLHHFLAYYGDKDDEIDPAVTNFLTSGRVLEKYDTNNNTPFSIFIQHAKKVDKYLERKGKSNEDFGRRINFQKLGDNCREILEILMDSKRKGVLDALKASKKRGQSNWGFISEIRNLPPWLFRPAVSHIHVQRMLNKAVSHPFSSAVLTLDFYVHVLLIVAFTSAVSNLTSRDTEGTSVQNDVEDTSAFYDEGWEEPCLVAIAIYLVVRELLQVASLTFMGLLPLWLVDLWNWFDIASIVLLWLATGEIMQTNHVFLSKLGEGLDGNGSQVLVMVTGGVVWVKMFSYLKSTYLSFSVFVSGMLHVIWILVPFAVTSGILLGAFALMYHVDSYDIEECDATSSMLTFCTLRDSFLKVYTMFVNGEIDENEFTSQRSTMWLSIIFGGLIIILLLTILIAIVTDSYQDVKRRGYEVFWSHRYSISLEFLAMMSAITCSGQRAVSANEDAPQSESSYLVTENLLNPLFENVLDDHRTGRGAMRWQKLEDRLKDTTFWDKCMAKWQPRFCGCSCRPLFLPLILIIKSVLLLVIFPIAKGIVLVMMGVWFITGCLTLGVLWPPQLREALFCPSLIKLQSGEEYELRKKVREIREGLAIVNNNVNGAKQELAKGIEDLSNLVKKSLENSDEEVPESCTSGIEHCTAYADV